MITIESMKDKIKDYKYSINVAETTRHDKQVWEFYYFNGSIDGCCSLAFFDPENFNLEILFAGQHYTDVDLIRGFDEGWFLSQYDWQELFFSSQTMNKEETAKYILCSGISEEQLFDEIIRQILCELEEAIGFEETAFYHLEAALKEIAPIVKRQTKEASK